jgi:hypothetical protein
MAYHSHYEYYPMNGDESKYLDWRELENLQANAMKDITERIQIVGIDFDKSSCAE